MTPVIAIYSFIHKRLWLKLIYQNNNKNKNITQ